MAEHVLFEVYHAVSNPPGLLSLRNDKAQHCQNDSSYPKDEDTWRAKMILFSRCNIWGGLPNHPIPPPLV